MLTASIAILSVCALGAAYVLGWRRGYAAGDNPRRRRTD